MNNIIKITQGQNKVFTIKIKDLDGEPFDLTNFTKYKVCFPTNDPDVYLEITEAANANGSKVELLGDPLLGKLQVTLNFNDSKNINPGDAQDLPVTINNAAGNDPRPKLAEKVLYVESFPCN